jgi:hypothetical protein
MRAIRLCIILLLGAIVINFLREGRLFHIARTLPFAGGETINIYDWAGVAVLVILAWGLYRIKHKDDDNY